MVAQSVEQVAVNHPVAGSSPAEGAISYQWFEFSTRNVLLVLFVLCSLVKISSIPAGHRDLRLGIGYI